MLVMLSERACAMSKHLDLSKSHVAWKYTCRRDCGSWLGAVCEWDPSTPAFGLRSVGCQPLFVTVQFTSCRALMRGSNCGRCATTGRTTPAGGPPLHHPWCVILCV